MKRLIIAYGNRDREDDGAGWHILANICERLGLNVPEYPGEWVETKDGALHFLYLFQLLPEMAEDICAYDEVIFIDAHNSEQLEDFLFDNVQPSTEHSAFTHHMSAGELLSIASVLKGTYPKAKMITVRGFSFQFKQQLSPKTAQLVKHASKVLLDYLELAQTDQTPYVEMPVKIFSDNTSQLTERVKPIICEHVLELIVNDQSWLSFICSPTDLVELAIGFLWNENVIADKSQIQSISLNSDLSAINIKINGNISKPESFHRTSTGFEPKITPHKTSRAKTTFFDKKSLSPLYLNFSTRQKMHDYSGGFHAAAVSDGHNINILMEDLGRHNCIDKLAGAWLLSGQEFEPRCLMLTGRVSSEMVMKSLALGLNMIISRTTPTVRAIELAEQAEICLIGYIRANQYEVYTHDEYLV